MFFEPIYIPWALNLGTCLRQGDPFNSAGLHRNHVLATASTRKIGRGFGKNAVTAVLSPTATDYRVQWERAVGLLI